MKQFLVINSNKDSLFLPFKEKFKLFNDPKKAMSHAESIGYENTFLSPNLETVGIKNTHQCGNVEVSILVLEAE